MAESGKKKDHTTLKHGHKTGRVEHNYRKLEQILKINVPSDIIRWDRCANVAVMVHITS